MCVATLVACSPSSEQCEGPECGLDGAGAFHFADATVIVPRSANDAGIGLDSQPPNDGGDESAMECGPGTSDHCTTGHPGVCGAGIHTCSAAGQWGTCEPHVLPGARQERKGRASCLNDEDDDCDGLVDLADADCRDCVPQDTGSCNTGRPGICNAGTKTCLASGDWGACESTVVPPTSEDAANCRNHLDDDCDGKTDSDDEDCWSCNPSTDPPESCNTGLKGICSAGTRTCSTSGTWGDCSVLTRPGTVSEDCINGEDDDCNGKTDSEEDECCDPSQQNTKRGCETGLPGICNPGLRTCSADGTWGGCDPNRMPNTRAEDCDNGLDDDCDRLTDGADLDDCAASSCPDDSHEQGGACVCDTNYATVGSTCKPVIEIFRFHSASLTDYLFTAVETELENNTDGYLPESSGNFKVFQRDEGGMRALRRCTSDFDHFLSVNPNSICEAPAGKPDGGVLGYIDPPSSGGQCGAHRKALYRCFSLANTIHLATTNVGECAGELAKEFILGCVPTD